jgi:hypothetical protein
MPSNRQYPTEGDGYHEFVFIIKSKFMVAITLVEPNDVSVATF